MRVFDLHCDTIYEIRRRRAAGEDCKLRSNRLHMDLERMKQAGYAMQTFALFVDVEEEDSPFWASMELLDIFREEMAANADLIGQIYSYADLVENEKNGRLSALLSVEDGGVSMGLPDILTEYHKAGVRLMSLTWNHENVFGYPNQVSPHAYGHMGSPEERGLKTKGFDALQQMEELGIIPDVSHLSDGGFWDVAKATRKPFIASHSNAREITGHMRNLTDDMIRTIAERGGLIGLNYCVAFLRENWEPGKGPQGSTLEEMTAHLRHLIQVGGSDCIALGSDYDGIREAPIFGGCEQIHQLAEAMERSGFHPDVVEKVMGKNADRFLRENLA